MAQHGFRVLLALCIALFAGTATAQGTLGTTAVGTTNYPTSGYEVVSSATCAEWGSERASVLDATNNVLYIASSVSLVSSYSFTKVPLPVGSAAIQTVQLGLMDGFSRGIAVDPVGGYLYIASGRQVLVYATNGRGEMPTRIGSFDPGVGDNGADSVTVNLANGDLYVGTSASSPRTASIVKYRRGTGGGLPTRIGSLLMNSGENNVSHGFIDPEGGYGVFVAGTFGFTSNPAHLVKVLLGEGTALPQRAGESAWMTTSTVGGLVGHAGSDTCYISHSVRDVAVWHAQVVKFDVSGSAPVDTGTYTTSENLDTNLLPKVLGTDPDGTHVVFIAWRSGGGMLFQKVEASSMTSLGSIFENGPVGKSGIGDFNPTTGRAYVPFYRLADFTTNMPNSILEIDSGSGATAPVELSFQTVQGTYDEIESITVDLETGHAFAGGKTPGQMYFSKIGYFPGASKPPEFSSTFWQATSNTDPASFAFDPIRRKLYRSYISKANFPPILKLEKFEPGNGGSAPTLESSMTANNSLIGTLVRFDFDKNEAYYGATSLSKASLGVGSEAPTIASSTGAVGFYGSFRSMAVDPIHGKVYAGCTGTDVNLVKISINEGTAQPTIDGMLSTSSGEVVSGFIALDPADGYGVIWMNEPRGRLLRFTVDGTTNAPVVTGVYDFPELDSVPTSNNPASAFLDTDADSLLLLGGFKIHHIDTGGAAGTMTYQGVTLLEDGTLSLNSIVPSGPNELLVSRGGERPTGLVKLTKRPVSMKNRLRAIAVIPPARTKVDDIRFYSHAAKGKLRFVIYSSFRNTVWTSPEIVNNVANGEIVVPISSGSPSEVILDGGTPYFLGFVSDSDTPVASFVSNTGNTLALRVDPLTIPKINYSGPVPYLVPENWSIYATTSIPDGLNSIQVLDSDGANSPWVGFTNHRDVLVVTGFHGPLPEVLEISDNNFSTYTSLPYAQTLPFSITHPTGGPFTIRARGRSASGTTNVAQFLVTLDTINPTANLVSEPEIAVTTSNPTSKIRITTSEPLNHFPDPTNPGEVELTNCTAGPVTAVTNRNFEFIITHLADGPVQVRIPAGGLSDPAGNPILAERKINYLYDTTPPTAALTVPLVAIGPATVHGTYTAQDASGLDLLLRLYSRRQGGIWLDEFINVLPDNRFTFTPGSGVPGTYELLLLATDQAGNVNLPVPSGMTGSGTVLMHYNSNPNHLVEASVSGPGSYFFAMEDDVLVRIDLSQVSGSGTLTVSREEGDLGPFAGTSQMLHERLNVAYAGFSFGDATLETYYEDENLGGLHESSIVTAARVRGASEPTFFPITHDPSWNRITVHGITNLRDTWYFGRVPSPAANWAMYE